MPRPFPSGLRARLLLLVLFAIIPALGLMLYNAAEGRRLAMARAEGDALQVAQEAASTHARFVEQARQVLMRLAQLPSMRRGPETRCRLIFNDLETQYLQQYPRYTNLGVISPAGEVSCSVLPFTGPARLADQPAFQAALQTLDFSPGNYELDQAIGRATVTLFQPVVDFEGGQALVVVFATLDMDWLNQLAAEADLPDGSTFTVVDHTGAVLIHYPDGGQRVGRIVPEPAVLEAIRTPPAENTLEARDAAGLQRLYAFAPLGQVARPGAERAAATAPGYIVIGIPAEIVFAEANRLLTSNLLALGAVAVLALAAAWAGGDLFILRQVQALVHATQRLSAGDLSARTGLPPAEGELSQLAQTFDRMAAALEQREAERQQSEAALRKSEELYRTLAQNFPNGAVLLFDHDLRYTLADGAGLAQVGLSKDMLEKATIWEVFPPEVVALLEPRYRAALAGTESAFEVPFAGRVYLVRTLPIRNERGDTQSVAGMVMTQDITESKQAEEALRARERQYRNIFESVNDGLLLYDLEGRPVDCNPAVSRMFGYTVEEFLQLRADDFVHPDSRSLFALFGDTVRAGREFQARGQMMRKDGSTFHAEARGSLFLYHGQPHVLAIVRDVTEEVAATQLLEQRVEARTRELAALLQVSRNITSTLELESVLGQFLDQIKAALDYSAASIFSREGEMFHCRAYRGPFPEEKALQIRYSANNAIDLHVISSRQPFYIPDLHDDTPVARYFRKVSGPEEFENLYAHIHSWLRVPLIVKEQVIGVLTLHHHEPGHYSPQQAELALAFADQAAAAIENARLFEAVQRRAEQFRVISAVGQRIAAILAVDELLVQTARLIRETFGYHHTHIGLIEGEEVVFKTAAAGPPDDPQYQNCEAVRLRVGEDGIVGWVAQRGEPLLVPDVRRDTRFVAAKGDQTCAELAVPIKVKGQVIGVIEAESERVNGFDESDVAVLQSLADQAAVGIENARLFEAEQRRAEQFRIIGEVGRRITSILAVDELLSQTVRLIRETFGYYHVHIGLIEDETVVFKASAGVWQQEAECLCCASQHLRVGREGVSGWVAGTGEHLLVPDIQKEPRYIPLQPGQSGSSLTLPLTVKGQVIGVLDVENERLNGFDQSDVAVLQSLAHQVAVAIENARLYEQAQQLAALEERQKLARELHDSVSQALYGIALGARTARTQLNRDPDRVVEPLDYVLSLSEAALAEMRALIFELRPESLAVEGLVAALDKHAASLHARHRLDVRTTFGDEPQVTLEVKEALYRIALEAMHNTIKHARASRVDLRLQETESGLLLEVRDDGAGFDPARSFPGHLGLQSMRERVDRLGGVLTVESAPGQGARVSVRIPKSPEHLL